MRGPKPPAIELDEAERTDKECSHMTSFRRLPPFLRALRVFWMLALLAAMGVLTWTFLATRSADQAGVSRGWNRASAISRSLFLLAMACNVMLVPYHRRFERPGRAEPWPATWQTQLTAALALAALPLWSLLFALLVPPPPSLSNVMNALQILALFLLIAAHLWMIHRAYE